MNNKYKNIDLFSRIKHFGYENEFPFCDDEGYDNYSDDFRDELESALGYNYSFHSECGGMEMVSPIFDTFTDLLNGIEHVYDAVDTVTSTPISTSDDTTMASLLYHNQSFDGYNAYWDAQDAFDECDRMDFPYEDDEDLARDMGMEFDDDTDFDNDERFVEVWNNYYDDWHDPNHYRFYHDFPYDISDFIDDSYDIRSLSDHDFFEYRKDLYDVIDDDNDDIYYRMNDDMFNGNEVGVHIRIDVSNWSTQEIFRYVRLFSNEWSCGDGFNNSSDRDWDYDYYRKSPYADFIKWMESYFGREWFNYNSPVPYKTWYNAFKKNTSTNNTSRPMSFKNKSHNASLEDGNFGNGVITIEMRAFGVNQYVDDAKHQATLIPLLCAIVEHSIANGDREKNVVDQLYDSWTYLIKDGNIAYLLNDDNEGDK